MKIINTELAPVKIVEPAVHGDSRGFFMETWNERAFQTIGISEGFVQDNQSRSARGVLRGLHYQIGNPQGKLVRVTTGAVFDVAVDLRRSSPTLGRWVGAVLSATNRRMLWIPEGFAHGFVALEDHTDFVYKCTDYYTPNSERTLRWNDPDIGISWPDTGNEPLVSQRDAMAANFSEAELFS